MTDREFHFQAEDFAAVRDLLYRRSGINLSEAKSNLVYSRLGRRLRLLNFTRFSEYLEFLGSSDEELEHFVNALTTNHTAFFREPHHFDILAEFARPYAEQNKPLKVWCAAASSGEEPWTIAMVLAETYRNWSPPVQIIATDIDSQILQQAEVGSYALARLSGISDSRKKRFFQKGKGQNIGKARVVPELRKLVTYQQLNLLDAKWNINGPFDIIFCRNVMIYFDKNTQTRILERMVKLIKPEGLYFAGHSESFVNAGHLVKLVGKSTYQAA